jgi:hypothetical protein
MNEIVHPDPRSKGISRTNGLSSYGATQACPTQDNPAAKRGIDQGSNGRVAGLRVQAAATVGADAPNGDAKLSSAQH